jgi:hypothetical protein
MKPHSDLIANAAQRTSLRAMDALFAFVQHRAFKGEL